MAYEQEDVLKCDSLKNKHRITGVHSIGFLYTTCGGGVFI